MRDLLTAAVMTASALAAGLLAGPAASAQPASPPWAQVSASSTLTCGVQTNRTMWCWGNNNRGQLGTSGHGVQDAPVRVGLRAGWTQVAAGGGHACAVRSDHSLWCWGDGSSGALGTGARTTRYHPVQVSGGDVYTSVSGSENTECAIRTDGTLWCWGDDTYGEVGDGTTGGFVLSPAQVGAAADWTGVSAAAGHACGIQADGSAWCWGAGLRGELGDGAPAGSDTPAQVEGSGVWTGISAGGPAAAGVTCGIQADATLWCWGADSAGQLGDGKGPDSDVPVQVGARTGWRQASAAADHACALHGGSLWCWGADADGLIGNGSATPITRPVKVSTPPAAYNWVQVSAGDDKDTCGIERGHTLWCWGLNEDDQLGLGSGAKLYNDTPQQVT